jgi:hypothetical protein
MYSAFTQSELDALIMSNELKVNTSILFTLKDSTTVIVGGSDIAGISVQNDLMATNKVSMGNCIPSIGDVSVYSVNLTFNPKNVKYYTIYYYIRVNDTDRPIPLGTFYPDNISNDGRTITFKGYDILKKFDKDFKESQIDRSLTKTLSARLVEACEVCNINPTVTIEDDPDNDAAYSFGTLLGYIMPQQDFDTYRSFVGCISAACGCNLAAGRGAEALKLISIHKQFDDYVDYTFPQSFSAVSENYSRSILFSSIIFRNYSKLATGKRKEEVEIEAGVTDDSIERIYKYGKNPFIEPQAMWNEINGRRAYIRARNRIAKQLTNSYEFFTLQLPPIPVFDVGDTIKIADSSGNWHWLYIASWTFDGINLTLRFGDPRSGASATSTGGAGMGYATVGGQIAQALNTVEDEADLGDVEVVKTSNTYLYNTALSEGINNNDILEKISANHLHADQKLDVLSEKIVKGDPVDNGDGTYTYTFQMQTGGEIHVVGSSWDFMVASSDNRATWNKYNVNQISISVNFTATRNDLFGIMLPTFTDMTGSAGDWRSSWEYTRRYWTAENVRTANRGLYYPIDANTIGSYGGSYDLTTPAIGQTYTLTLQGDDVVLEDSTVYSGNFVVGNLTVTGVASDVPLNTGGFHLTGTLVVGNCYIKTGSSSYDWAGPGDTVTIRMYLKHMAHGNHIAGDMPNLQETITSDNDGSVAILSQEYLRHTEGTINISASGKAYKWYKQLLQSGHYNAASDNDINVDLDHYMISGYGNEIVDDTTNPSAVDIIGNNNNIEDCKNESERIIIGSDNDITEFPSVSGVKMDGIFIGNSGTGIMWYKASNMMKFYRDYTEVSLAGVTYTLSKSQDGTQIILTGSDGSVQTIIDKDTVYDDTSVWTALNNLQSALLDYYTKTEIDTLLSSITSAIETLSADVTEIQEFLADDDGFANYQDEQDSIEEIFGTVYFITESGVRLQTADSEDIVLA